MSLDTRLPRSRAEILELQSQRKRRAFERARLLPWYRDRLDGVDPAQLDDPEVWSQIPILDKDTLRRFDHQRFMDLFCAVPASSVAEYWRSGGATGKPVFYPRTAADIRHALVAWGRSFPCMGIGAGHHCHMSFPLGVHPAGQIWSRSAVEYGVGLTWVGAGGGLSSQAQIELMLTLRPNVFMGMSSFALHLANVAAEQNIDLAASSIGKVVCSAEILTRSKREKIETLWGGAEVFDVFGMSEAGLMGAEGNARDGLHIWTDHYFIEVVDADTGRAVPEGEVGSLCVTPLLCNEATPFLRWSSGDLVSYRSSGGVGVFAELFPLISHAHRTSGFFKIKGVNINHADLEELLFSFAEIRDFQCVAQLLAGGALEGLRIRAELAPGADAQALSSRAQGALKDRFEISAQVEVVGPGVLAREFDKAIKAPRFVDERHDA